MFALDAREIISDDLRNPLVAPHLDFLPEDAHGKGIFKTSQSAKWLKHLAPDIRVQMVAYNKKHYYTYEPVQLKNDNIIIPIFFYTLQSNTFAKCYKPQITSNRHNSTVKIAIASDILYDDPDLQEINLDDFDLLYSEIVSSDGLKLLEYCGNLLYEQNSEGTIKLPNPWREKANGRIIRHVPVNMYCDDTSGNKSKKWNKHISYYFTLSGLPPNLSNQQFNCHFLCTSNIAGALDLGEIVVQQLNEMVNDGFEAYDMILSQNVLVMAPLLCFLANSPMQAEITNTPVPGPSLNPCRVCVLSSKTIKDRNTLGYISRFVNKNTHGSNHPNNLRTTEKTIKDSEEVWRYVKENALTLNLEKLNEKSAEFGIRDQTNRKFAKQIISFREKKKELLLDGKEIPPDMDQPIPQDLVDLESKDKTQVLSPFLKLKGLCFDMVRDTPVEILHVFLLGIVKYLFTEFMSRLD
ncbi:uncharacterized protein PGTG_09350 [Puccinia graminis f. sp. tritici CRL 75-36-700-3]|uniref:Uncharacterized protein n=1 Tax=Puccinia graminis f. sp. tritici (strain CRL 75-36-700-3 / race SCCL) TaxID=418459 RepID=E3KH62_PUCGT|nr:uncharacterized protein PGTG_09350 [Puccinia graminis f. sp. tritici CRL 75-36-700-3]EFP83637.2 hypothetical protein PGTG_09350 [Puccinia graminis f. sp. tritici CRL 75-36-700-3]